MDGAPLEPVTMVSALPARLALAALGRARDEPSDPPDEFDVLPWDALRTPGLRPEEEPSLTAPPTSGAAPPDRAGQGSRPDRQREIDVHGWHAWWWQRGFDGALLAGCPRHLLAGPGEPRQHVDLDPDVTVEVGFLPATAFLARLMAHGEPRQRWWLSLPPGVEDPSPADADPWHTRLETLWLLLNRGHTLLLVPEGRNGPAEHLATAEDTGPVGGSRADEAAGTGDGAACEDPTGHRPPPEVETSPEGVAALDRLPPLRTGAPIGIPGVPAHLVIVDAGDAEAPAVVDGLGRLIAQVPDARFSVPDAAPATRALLAARFHADPRYLDGDGLVPPATPYLVHTSIELPLSSAVVANLVDRSAERDASVVRVLLSEGGEGPGHLALTRLAAVHRSHGPLDELRPSSPVLAPDGLDEIARVTGVDWVLPEQVGLETPDADRSADVLGSSGAMPAKELALVGRLQRKVLAMERKRDELSRRLATETRARRKAEESLERLQARKVVRLADRLGRARSRLTR